MARSKGGGVKVSSGGTLWERWGRGRRRQCDSVYGLRKRTAATCSKVGVEAMACSEARDEAAVCSGPGSRTACGGGMMVSRETEERERAYGRKIAKCGERERGTWTFRARDLMRDTLLSHASPFSSYWRHVYYSPVSHFIAKGDEVLVSRLTLIRKQDTLHTDASPFILLHSTWYRSLVPPRLLKLMLTSF
jgi:hypothetical protein